MSAPAESSRKASQPHLPTRWRDGSLDFGRGVIGPSAEDVAEYNSHGLAVIDARSEVGQVLGFWERTKDVTGKAYRWLDAHSGYRLRPVSTATVGTLLALAADSEATRAALSTIVPSIDVNITSRAEAAENSQPADFSLRPPELEGALSPDIPQGWFFTQTRGADKPYPMGYIVYNDTKNNIPMWNLYQQWGGREKFGLPITDRYQTPQGTWIQLFQTGGAEWNPTTKTFGFVNGFDVMERAGIKLDQTWYKIPNSREGVWNSSLPWGHDQNGPFPRTIEANQIDRIFCTDFIPDVPAEKIQALKTYYLSFPDWFDRFGLPTGIEYFPDEDILSVRTQRASIQSRKTPLPGSILKPYEPVAIYASQVMRDYAKDTGTLIPKEALEAKYNPYGVGGPENPFHYIKRQLQELLTYTTEANGIKYPNALGLNSDDVNGYINGSLEEKDIKSFQFIKNRNGIPLAILVTGGKYGLRPDRPNIANIQAAIRRLNEIDPTELEELTEGFGLKAITGDEKPGSMFDQYPGYGTTYDEKGILFFNEKAQDFSIASALARILSESRGIYVSNHLVWDGSKWVNGAPGSLHWHRGVDKTMWLEQWIEAHKTQLITTDLYRDMKELADAWLKSYLDIAKKEAAAQKLANKKNVNSLNVVGLRLAGLSA